MPACSYIVTRCIVSRCDRAGAVHPGQPRDGRAARLRHRPGRRGALRGPGPAHRRHAVRRAQPARRRRAGDPVPRGRGRRPPPSLLPAHGGRQDRAGRGDRAAAVRSPRHWGRGRVPAPRAGRGRHERALAGPVPARLPEGPPRARRRLPARPGPRARRGVRRTSAGALAAARRAARAVRGVRRRAVLVAAVAVVTLASRWRRSSAESVAVEVAVEVERSSAGCDGRSGELVAVCESRPAARTPDPAPRRSIVRFVDRTVPDGASGTLVAMRGHDVVACEGFGLADRAAGRAGRAATPSTTSAR